MKHNGREYTLSNNIISKRTGEDVTLLLKEDKGDLLSLNESGGIIFEAIKSKKDKAEIIKELEAVFDEKHEIIIKEFDEFIERLIHLEILILR